MKDFIDEEKQTIKAEEAKLKAARRARNDDGVAPWLNIPTCMAKSIIFSFFDSLTHAFVADEQVQRSVANEILKLHTSDAPFLAKIPEDYAFDLNDYVNDVQAALRESRSLQQRRFDLVPSRMNDARFFRAYYYHVAQIKANYGIADNALRNDGATIENERSQEQPAPAPPTDDDKLDDEPETTVNNDTQASSSTDNHALNDTDERVNALLADDPDTTKSASDKEITQVEPSERNLDADIDAVLANIETDSAPVDTDEDWEAAMEKELGM